MNLEVPCSSLSLINRYCDWTFHCRRSSQIPLQARSMSVAEKILFSQHLFLKNDIINNSLIPPPQGFERIPAHGLLLGSFAMTLRYTTVSGNPLNKWSARRKEFYLKTRNIYNRHTSMSPAGFELNIPARRRRQNQWHQDRQWFINEFIVFETMFIHSFSSLSYDRSKASSKASSPHSAIQSFLLQMRLSSPFLKVIQ